VRPGADIRAAVQVLARLPRQADVPRSDLIRGELTGAASLAGLTLTNADLSGAELSGANLSHAIGLEQEQVDAAQGDETTVLPARISRPASWTVS